MYVFWVRDRRRNSSSKLLMCSMTSEAVSVAARRRIDIPLADITACEILPPRGLDGEYRVQFETAGHADEVLLSPVDPLEPDEISGGKHEASAMVAVVEALRAGETPSLDPNPYLRELARRGIRPPADIVLDPEQSPRKYYDLFHPPATMRQMLIYIGLVFAVMIVVFLALLALSGGILITPAR